MIVDDNDVTIAGHPSEYLKGYDLTKTLEGHGLKVCEVQGEDIDALWGAISTIVTHKGPAAGKCYIRSSCAYNLHFHSRCEAADGPRSRRYSGFNSWSRCRPSQGRHQLL